MGVRVVNVDAFSGVVDVVSTYDTSAWCRIKIYTPGIGVIDVVALYNDIRCFDADKCTDGWGLMLAGVSNGEWFEGNKIFGDLYGVSFIF